MSLVIKARLRSSQTLILVTDQRHAGFAQPGGENECSNGDEVGQDVSESQFIVRDGLELTPNQRRCHFVGAAMKQREAKARSNVRLTRTFTASLSVGSGVIECNGILWWSLAGKVRL